jgi:hypothetical protein
LEVDYKMEKKAGEWAFLIGFLLAVLFGFLPDQWEGTATLLLVVLGLIVGFLNVSEKESTPFLVATAALMITSSAGSTLALIPPDFLGNFLQNAVEKIGVFVAPAAIVVAIKSVRSLAKD